MHAESNKTVIITVTESAMDESILYEYVYIKRAIFNQECSFY